MAAATDLSISSELALCALSTASWISLAVSGVGSGSGPLQAMAKIRAAIAATMATELHFNGLCLIFSSSSCLCSCGDTWDFPMCGTAPCVIGFSFNDWSQDHLSCTETKYQLMVRDSLTSTNWNKLLLTYVSVAIAAGPIQRAVAVDDPSRNVGANSPE